jgi:hypothetical protein
MSYYAETAKLNWSRQSQWPSLSSIPSPRHQDHEHLKAIPSTSDATACFIVTFPSCLANEQTLHLFTFRAYLRRVDDIVLLGMKEIQSILHYASKAAHSIPASSLSVISTPCQATPKMVYVCESSAKQGKVKMLMPEYPSTRSHSLSHDFARQCEQYSS